MARDPFQRPSFVELFLTVTAEAYRHDGIKAIFPWFILVCSVLGFAVGYYASASFWENNSLSISFYVGLLTFNGLLFAFGWSIFARIFENICENRFLAYLQDENILGSYIFVIAYVQIALLLSVIITSASLVALLFDFLPLFINRILLGASVAACVYAVKETTGTVTTLYDLIWLKSHFPTNDQTKQSNITKLTKP